MARKPDHPAGTPADKGHHAQTGHGAKDQRRRRTPPKPFRTVDAKYRRAFPPGLRDTHCHRSTDPAHRNCPRAREAALEAAAKSHRPEQLFSAQSCPIIGGGRLGELFVKATPEGLDRLADIIENNTSDQMTKELSCVETIEPVTPLYRRGGLEATDVLRRSPRGKHGFITRVGLFNFGADSDQPKLVEDFESTCRKRDIRLSKTGYSPSSFTYGYRMPGR